jgi:hypothetical protein
VARILRGDIVPTEHLKIELETYERLKPQLVAQGEGKYVLIQGTTVVNIWDTYEDALKAGYSQFGIDTPFLVKQISRVERILSFTRALTPCPS